jgi:hypothetical protein
VVDGNPLAEEEVVGGGVLPGVVAGGSSSKLLLHLQWKTTVRFLDSDDDVVGRGGAQRRAEWRTQMSQSRGERSK